MNCSNGLNIQGVGYIEFHELASSKLKELALEHGGKLYNVAFNIWCENCKWKLKRSPYIGYRTYKLMKRHSFLNQDHCVHCDPEGDIPVKR